MGKYIGKRMLHLVGILIALSFLTFLLMYLAPGDAATKKLNAQGIAVSQEVLEQTRKAMGLDRPFLVQYGDWAVHVLRGDLGNSYKDGQSVAGKLGKALGYTPQGLANGWEMNVLMPDYSLEGMNEVVAYILSAIIGVALLVILFKLISIPMKGRKQSA